MAWGSGIHDRNLIISRQTGSFPIKIVPIFISLFAQSLAEAAYEESTTVFAS